MISVYGYSRCCASTCTNTSRNTRLCGVMYCRIPKDERRKIWLERAGRQDLLQLDPLELYAKKRLCTAHFEDSQFVSRQRKRLNWNALPTIFRNSREDESHRNKTSSVTGADFRVSTKENVSTFHSGAQNSMEDVAAVVINSEVNVEKQMKGGPVKTAVRRDMKAETADRQKKQGAVKGKIDVGLKRKDSSPKEQNVTAVKLEGGLERIGEGIDTMYLVKNISSQLSCEVQLLGMLHKRNRWRRIAPKVHDPAEREGACKVAKGQSSNDQVHKASLGERSKMLSCLVCPFKTIHQSVLLWHLRLHFRNDLQCDYCGVSLPERQSPPPADSGGTMLPQCDSVSVPVGSDHEFPDLTESEVPDYSVVEVSTCPVRLYKNVCRICSFKTDYDSVMIWHLRMHMKNHLQCDYCFERVPRHMNPRQLKSKHHRKLKSRKMAGSGVDVVFGKNVSGMRSEEHSHGGVEVGSELTGVPGLILPSSGVENSAVVPCLI